MTRKIIITFALLLAVFLISCNNKGKTEEKPSANNLFVKMDYDTVIAYSYDGEGDIEIIDKEGKLATKIKKQVVLNTSQIIRLTNIFCDKSTYGGAIAACFDPHFGIVFYKANKPVAYVSVCLACNYLVASLKLPFEDGFSEKGINKIVDFEKEIKF
jgi:hypothetical protein